MTTFQIVFIALVLSAAAYFGYRRMGGVSGSLKAVGFLVAFGIAGSLADGSFWQIFEP